MRPRQIVVIRGREIEVSQISVGAMMKLQSEGKDSNIVALARASVRPEDNTYLDDIPYDAKTSEQEIATLIKAWKETNPSFFPTPEVTAPSSSGQPASSDSPPTK